MSEQTRNLRVRSFDSNTQEAVKRPRAEVVSQQRIGTAMRDEEETDSDVDSVDVNYAELRHVSLNDSHRAHVNKCSRRLRLPFDFVALLQMTRVAKVCRMFCAEYH